jgi:hypothetical protein
MVCVARVTLQVGDDFFPRGHDDEPVQYLQPGGGTANQHYVIGIIVSEKSDNPVFWGAISGRHGLVLCGPANWCLGACISVSA